jgi:hypothetical protein
MAPKILDRPITVVEQQYDRLLEGGFLDENFRTDIYVIDEVPVAEGVNAHNPLGYSTSGQEWRPKLLEFSGVVNVPCTVITSYIGENQGEQKIVRDDMPLAGLRRFLARRRLGRHIKSRFK